MKIDSFYREAAELTRRDLAKQKMLLPMETITELCQAYDRQAKKLADRVAKRSDFDAKMMVIAGIQKEFPTSGTVMGDFKPLEMAQQFESAGAAALAPVTEKHFFGGEPKHLTGITHLVKIPVIRWDFIVEEYQVMQSRLWGADAVRIVVSLLDQSELDSIIRCCTANFLEIVAEVHTKSDIDRLQSHWSDIAAVAVDPGDGDAAIFEELLQSIPDNEKLLKLAVADNLDPDELNKLHCDAALFFEKTAISPPLLRQFAPRKELL